MTNLECSVFNCANNKDNLCCRPDIHVNGPSACASEQTCCSSFVDATAGAQNSTGYSFPNTSLQISCDARNCTFNQNERCSADHIRVSPEEQFPDTESKTECASFEFR